ncbi:MAG: polyprenyl synthetase family protein [Magnetococcus sp. DMHC-6]
MDLTLYLHERRTWIESALENLVSTADQPSLRLNAAIRHSLLGAGKRLRPILVLASAEAVGGDSQRVMPFACAMECIHTYSLIHDDLPAMDNDDLRRGRPTCHKAFDEASAILAGDGLLTLAFEVAATPVAGISAEVILATLVQLAKDAGISGMVGGQMLDLQAENRSISVEELRHIHRHKTGALIRCSCLAGARLGGGDAEQVKLLQHYGESMGLAFQIMDDILDEIGDSQVMGKNQGSDRARAKATYPQLMGIDQARQQAMQLVSQSVDLLEPFSSAADPLRALARFILTRTH